MLAYLELGIRHILDLGAYDHMLFLVALIANYRWQQWKPVLFNATAFTIGHSITLAITVLGFSLIPSNWVEFLIPITIILTTGINFLLNNRSERHYIKYILALCFGLIHGMGFAGYLVSLLGDSDVVLPLFGFNLGVELGQIFAIAVILALNFIIIRTNDHFQRYWSKGLNLIALTVSLHLAIQTWPL